LSLDGELSVQPGWPHGKMSLNCGANATKQLPPDAKAAAAIAPRPPLKQNAPSFPDSGSGSAQ